MNEYEPPTWDDIMHDMTRFADQYEELRGIDTTAPDFDAEMIRVRDIWLEYGIDLTNVAVLAAIIHTLRTVRVAYQLAVTNCAGALTDPEGTMHGLAHMNGVAAEYLSLTRHFWRQYGEGLDLGEATP